MPSKTESLKQIRNWVRQVKTEALDSGDVTQELGAKDLKKTGLTPIAITGLSGYLPGCMSVRSFWESLDRDESLISEIPADRFDWKEYWDPERERAPSIRSKWGGFIPDIASFDPEFFDILPMEADEMDPRQRLLLMSTWQTLLDAGMDPGSLRKSKTGVFIACEENEYAQLMARESFVPSMGMSQTDSMMANRISYQFDFAGPSEMVNATCAGFAVALHRAVVSLRAGLVDRAIVGAANLILLPDSYVVLSESEQLSTEDTVRSFGKGGDGFVRAEGVGTILIERNEDAEAAGRTNYALIKHTGVNFNGQGGVSMAAPNIEAHTELIKACYREAEIDPSRLTYLEAQGMGSPVADIAEWAALNRALSELCQEAGVKAEPGFCRVSTLKPMMGHMHAASSLGALFKIIRSFQTKRIHKVLGFGEANEYCEMENMPCRIAEVTERWESDGQPRIAALHSFGSGGNNAHVLLEEGQAQQRYQATQSKRFDAEIFNKRPYWFQAPQQLGEEASRTHPDEVALVIGEMLGMEVTGAQRDMAFLDLGLDSLALAGVVSKLKERFEVPLRKSDAFSYSTPQRMAEHVSQLCSKNAPRAGGRKVAPDEKPRAADDIAIVGMSIKVAGAETPSQFWELLKEGRCEISNLPEGRRPESSEVLEGIRGGFLEDIANFDPLFFNISPKECQNMDPRHRALLESAWTAIEDSGYSPSDWKDAENGIFVGIEESDYAINEASSITSVHAGTAPARIGYLLDLKGPLLALSTACSSSLVAVHSACQSLLQGESEVALAGGCHLVCQPERTFMALSQMGDMLSPDGTCYAFDSRANGMVMGEGVGLVVLKRLSSARRDGDAIYAVIKGSGVNYDGRTNGLTAPNGERQRELYEKVYEKSGVKPEQISYVVSHGTGTSLGDPVEGNALIDAFSEAKKKQFCALTSPKCNIGHTQTAAGIVNLITAALALQHRQIPPSLNFVQQNADIDFENSPFYVNTQLKDWEETERYAAVSSFGHTGTNAHVVLGEAEDIPSNPERKDKQLPVAVVLSAKSSAQLKALAAGLLDLSEVNLDGLAYTLQVGRQPMEARLGCVVDSIDALRELLSAFVEGREESESIFVGECEETFKSDEIAQLLEKGRLKELVQRWVQGALVDWKNLYREEHPLRVHLPTSPFEKERFWLDAEQGRLASVSEAEESFELMTFAETWDPMPLPDLDETWTGRVHICLAHQAGQREFLDGMRKCFTNVSVVKEEEAGAYRDALKEARAEETVLFNYQIEDADQLVIPEEFLALVQALAALPHAPSRLFFVVSFADELERCFADTWVGFAQSIRLLLPKTRMKVVALDSESSRQKERLLGTELNSRDGDSVLYLRGERYGLRIQPTELRSGSSSLRVGGHYLITGGLGGIGFLFAKRLAEKYQARLLLLGRSPIDKKKERQLEQLKRLGATQVRYEQVDVSDEVSLRVTAEKVKKDLGPIHGVIHSAGIEGTVSVLEKTAQDFTTVLEPKVGGTLVLDQVFQNEALDFMACFSSTAAILGDVGVCDYAMANRFEMAFARYRNDLVSKGERSGCTVVIHWPMWKEGGMVDADSERSRFYLETSGQRALETEQGLEIFEQVLSENNSTQALVVSGEPEKVSRFLRISQSAPREEKRVSSTVTEKIRSADMIGLTTRECVEQELKRGIGWLLKIESSKLKPKANLSDFGFDSMSLADFAAWLSELYGIEVTPAVFFGYSTIAALSDYLLERHDEVLEAYYREREVHAIPSSEPVSQSIPKVMLNEGAAKTAIDEPIAIIGMSGRFPQARNIEEMWAILEDGRNVVEEVPLTRFDWRPHFGDPALDETKTNGKWCGLLPGVDEFDPLFFEISPREAAGMDPRQRHLVQESWNALENAGYGAGQIAKEKIGMFVGVEEGDYIFLAEQGELTSNHSGILASRLAYFLDLRGPIIALNTACSSGLVAAHQACQSLRSGECDAALVAGVNIHATPAGLIAMGQSAMLSNDGKCHTFDKDANGMVPGEAVVALLLKPLSRAEADGDPIHAVIRASGVNYDGKTNGITAPSMVAQVELLESVYERGKINPSSLDYIVTHGTGTKLGDPVEVNALLEVFRDAEGESASCALTSTKTNFGHTFAASGLLSAVCLVESLKRETIPASLHCEEENPFIDWSKSPFYVNKESKTWPRSDERRRRGAVSAFGMSGTNAHMVVEEYDRGDQKASANLPCYLLPLSGKTEDALRERIVAMLGWLADEKKEIDLTSFSATLLEGRHHFQYRLAIVASRLDEAKFLWEEALAGGKRPNILRNQVPQDFVGQRLIRQQAEGLLRGCGCLVADPAEYQETLRALGDFYCQGYDLPWSELFGERTWRRLCLPGYPFARETYWLDSTREVGSEKELEEEAIHLLVHRNTSDFEEQRFTSNFTGKEFFLNDHRLHGEAILPGVAQLEMARVALRESSTEVGPERHLVLSQVVWLNPILVPGEGREVSLGIVESGDEVSFEIYSTSDAEEVVHGQGRLGFIEKEAHELTHDLVSLEKRMNRGEIGASECYEAFEAVGMEYGESFRVVQQIHLGDQEALARLSLPEAWQMEDFELHPSLMDGVFQSTLGLALFAEIEAIPRIPFALERVEVFAACPPEGWVWARQASGREEGKFELDFCDQDGRVCVRVMGLSTRPITPAVERSKMQRTLTGDEFFLRDHGGLLPGVVSLEWAREAGSKFCGKKITGIEKVIWSKGIVVKDSPVPVEVWVNEAGDQAEFQIHANELLHAQGRVLTSSLPTNETKVNIGAVKDACAQVIERDEYEALLKTKMGPSFQAISRFQYAHDLAVARLALPKSVEDGASSFVLHPSLLNGAVQAANILACLSGSKSSSPIPFSLDALRIYREIPDEVDAVARRNFSSVTPGNFAQFDIDLVDVDGEVIVALEGYTAALVTSPADEVICAVPGWEEGKIKTRERDATQFGSQLFYLAKGDRELEESLKQRWPNARICQLAHECQESVVEVLEGIQQGMKGEGESSSACFVFLNGGADLPRQAAFSGLMRTGKLERSDFVGKVISFDEKAELSTSELLRCVVDEHAAANDEVEVHFDSRGQRKVRTLKEIELVKSKTEFVVQEGDVLWITGGLGGIGKIFAEHFGQVRKAKVVLSGRSPLDGAKQAFLESLRARGVEVRYVQGDLANEEEAEAMLASILEREGTLTGILHAAGVIEDAYLSKKSSDEVRRVLAPKIAGTLVLGRVTSQLDLGFFVLFSSLTGVFGNPGQADYAAANGFLDGFAAERQLRGRGRTLSLNWPLWRDGGMTMGEESERLLKQSSGMVPMSGTAGVEALERALAGDQSQVLVVAGEREKIRSKLLRSRENGKKRAPERQQESGTVLAPLQRQLVDVVADLQKVPVERIELDAELSQYGFDSLAMTTFAHRLNDLYGLDLMPTVFFEFSNLKKLSRYLMENFSAQVSQRKESSKESAGSPSRKTQQGRRRSRRRPVSHAKIVQPIAIVGASGRFPGASDLKSFWGNLEANRDLVSEVPEDRWSWQDYYGDPAEERGKTKVKSAGFMEGIDRFDASFFGVSPREAIAMDPQFRLLLETTWSAIEDSGTRPSDLAGTKTGVFMAASTSDYKDAWLQEIGTDSREEGPPLVSHFVLANRISYIFDLHGPSEPIDTACSSSLVAIHRAIEAIRSGACEQALVGGVNVIASPNITLGASRAGMLSEDGRCKTFDQRADGYGRGEGVGVIFLKPLDKALEAGDPIYGLVKGSAENHGGKANSPTSPNPAAQKDLLVTAYRQAGIDPRSVGFIEAHGTGTELGDPIEINGLRSAFAELYEGRNLSVKQAHCGLGSVKTNIGHLEAAAGIAGVLKVLLMLRHHKIPGNPHLKDPNPYLELDGTPFFLAQETRAWEANGAPRRAGVSSFGIGGSNAHLILEEYSRDEATSIAELPGTQLVVLSARTDEGLRAISQRLVSALENLAGLGNPCLAELAYTLQAGRDGLEERLCFTADSLEEVRTVLNGFLEGGEAQGVVLRRSLKRGSQRRFDDNEELRERVLAWTEEGNLNRLMELWGRGVELDWQAMHGGRQLRKVSLPTYPFQGQRYWFAKKEKKIVTPPVNKGKVTLAALETSGVAEENQVLSNSVKIQLQPTLLEPLDRQPELQKKVVQHPGISREEMEVALAQSLAEILLMSEEEIQPDCPFVDLGLDSVIGVEWVQAINQRYGTQIAATKIYDYPTLDGMADYLMEELGGAQIDVPKREDLDFEEVLLLVQQKKMSVEEADRLLLDLEKAAAK